MKLRIFARKIEFVFFIFAGFVPFFGYEAAFADSRILSDSTINYLNDVYNGYAEFRSRTFKSCVDFQYSRFNDTANFNSATFIQTAKFMEITFNSLAGFEIAFFHGSADFSKSKFLDYACFYKSRFDRPVSFDTADFASKVFFDSSIFSSKAYFRGATLNSTISFYKSEFYDTADFSNTHFKANVILENSFFHSAPKFRSVIFDSDVNFRFAKFNSSADFDSCIFGGLADFSWALMPDTLNLGHVTEIKKQIDLSSAIRPNGMKRCLINLIKSDISKIKLNMHTFDLYFPVDTIIFSRPDSIISENIINISYTTQRNTITFVDTIITPSMDERKGVYECVLKKFKDDGFMDSYEILDKEYRKFKYDNDNKFNKYVVGKLDWLWWDYGYDKIRILYISVAFWLIFSLINKWIYNKITNQVYSIPRLQNLHSWSAKKICRWLFDYLVAVIYTGIIFFGLKLKIENFAPDTSRHKGLFIYLMIVYVSGLVCLGFIANIIFG